MIRLSNVDFVFFLLSDEKALCADDFLREGVFFYLNFYWFCLSGKEKQNKYKLRFFAFIHIFLEEKVGGKRKLSFYLARAFALGHLEFIQSIFLEVKNKDRFSKRKMKNGI